MKQTQILQDLAASNTTKTLQPVHIIPAEPESAEHELGLTPEEAAAMVDITASVARRGLEDAMDMFSAPYETPDPYAAISSYSEQSPESAALDQLIANTGSSRIAAIPAINHDVDPVVERGPIDIIVAGSCHVKNPA